MPHPRRPHARQVRWPRCAAKATGSTRSSSATGRRTGSTTADRSGGAPRSRGRPSRSRPAGSRTGPRTAPSAVLWWDDAALDPGWCKLDWVIEDPVDHGLVNASNMLDVTWEAPDGSITPLDGFLDSVLPGGLPRDRVDPALLEAREGARRGLGRGLRRDPHPRGLEVHGQGPELRQGRAPAVQRLPADRAGTPEAAYLRELFDEPVTALYQVAALLRTLDEASGDPGTRSTRRRWSPSSTG